jgi:hypothetical protein
VKRKPSVCIVYEPGSDCVELAPGGGLRWRIATEYEVWMANCLDPGTHIASSKSRAWANRICIGLAMSMGLRAMPAGAS